MSDELKPAEISPELAARIALLRAEYRAVLPDRLAELLAAVVLARTTPSAIGGALAIAHRLAGTAGSYGFHELGDACAAVEDALARAQTNADWGPVDAALASAAATLAT